MVLTVFLAAAVWGDVVLEVEEATVFSNTSAVLNFSMASPDDEVAALQVDILFDTGCFTVTDVQPTSRSAELSIFQYSDIDGGIRVALTGIGESILPGTGAVAEISVDIGDCEGVYPFDVTECVVADPLGVEIACSENDNDVTVSLATCVPGLSVEAIDMGDVRVGTAGTMVVTVTNTGNDDGTVAIATDGCAYASATGFDLAEGANTTVDMGCMPEALGACSGTITVSCGTSDPVEIPVSCNGVASAADCGGPYDFGEVTILETGQIAINITNTGDAVLNISGFDIDFQLNYATTTPFEPVDPGETFVFLLFWNPDAASGPQTGTITFHSDALEGDCVAELTGESILPPEAVLSLCKDPYNDCVDSVVVKPDSSFDVQVVITQVPPPGIVPPEMEIVSVYMKLAIDTCFYLFNGDSMVIVGGGGGDIGFDGEKTVLDSMGWDIKWHYLDYYPAGDFLEIWLIGGAAMFENGCILNLGFTMLSPPGAAGCPFELCDDGETSLSFVTATFNEGLPFIVTNDLRVIRNRPPAWVTADITGEIQEGVGTYCSALDSEQDTLEYTICATDLDPDSIRLAGAIFDAGWVCGNYGVVNPGDVFYGTGCWDVWYAPDKPCVGTYVDTFIVESCWTTGQPCFDTLYITTEVILTESHVFWGQNPTGGPGPGAFTHDGDFTLPDTTDVTSCGSIELPVWLCWNDLYVPDPNEIYSIDLILDYPMDLTIGHVGYAGLITEGLGALTYSVGEGLICVSMAFNYPILLEDFCAPIMYVEFLFPAEAPIGTIYELSIDHVKLNEAAPTVCWQYGYLEVSRASSLGGDIYISDPPYDPVPDVTVTVSPEYPCDGGEVTYTDALGEYTIAPTTGCENPVCVCVSKEDADVTGVVTAADASLILRSLCNQVILTKDQQLSADVTCDGTVSAYDAAILLQHVVGIDVSTLSCIGQWVFEYVGTLVDYHGLDYYCVANLQTTLLAEDFEAALRGDVTQNYAPKSVVGVTPDVAFRGRSATIHLGSDVYSATLELVGVTARDVIVPEGMESAWNAVDGVTRIAVAGAEAMDAAITVIVDSGENLELYGNVNEVPFATRTVKVPVIPAEYSLAQNYPNPFNPETTIEFGMPDDAQVKVTVFNVLGQVVTSLVDSEMPAGYHVVTWDASDMASGVYFYRIQAGEYTATKRMVLMK
jgi:hypothetical protein